MNTSMGLVPKNHHCQKTMTKFPRFRVVVVVVVLTLTRIIKSVVTGVKKPRRSEKILAKMRYCTSIV